MYRRFAELVRVRVLPVPSTRTTLAVMANGFRAHAKVGRTVNVLVPIRNVDPNIFARPARGKVTAGPPTLDRSRRRTVTVSKDESRGVGDTITRSKASVSD